MYAIRVRAVDGLIEATFSGHLSPEEALRAVAQAFTLAEAGDITLGIGDLTGIGRQSSSIVVLGAAFAAKFKDTQRLAVVCSTEQLAFCRRLARLSSFDGRLGIFTREADATQWLATSVPSGRISSTAQRHLAVEPQTASATTPARERRRAAS